MTDAPDASVKLRTVLDYLPCEACLAQPVRDQELLCSICRRIDRQVGVRIAVRRTVLVERPSEPSPVVIPPPAPAAPAADAVDVVLASPEAPLPEPRVGVPQVVLEPLGAEAPAAAAPDEEEPAWDDLVSWEAPDDAFEYVKPAAVPAPPPPAPPAEVPQDDYVFRPPPADEPVEAPREAEPAEDWMPAEEVRVEPESDSRWAPPVAPEPAPEAAPVEPEPIEAAPEPEPEVVETVVDEPAAAPVQAEAVEEEVLDAEVVPDEPAPEDASNLWRLRGFDRASEDALRAHGITEVAHLAGHDAADLSARTGIAAERLAPWIQVADLTQEAGVPLDAAIALVTAGVPGPKGLREMDADAIVDRVQAFSSARVALSDVKRWKRRV